MIFGEESKWASNVLHFTDWAEVVFSWSLPLHYKSEEKALLCKAFPVFMIFTYTSFDCVDYRPTTFNFCILSRFSSSEACTYRSNVIVTEACGAAVRMKKANHNLLSNQIASLGLGALLICMPEPVVDANPYFFFAILMLLGGIKGVECSFGKEDTAESERGF